MSKFYQSKTGKPASKVKQLVEMPPEGWEQRTGWKLEGEFGFMACGAAANDRLVGLADLLRWIQSERTLPRAAALQALIDGIPDDVMTWVYLLEPKGQDYAKAVPVDAMFGSMTSKEIETAKAKHRQDLMQRDHERRLRYGGGFQSAIGARTAWPDPVEPGRPALLKALSGRRWQQYLNVLAVPVHKAFAVWGWGGILTAEAVPTVTLARVLVKDQKPEWTGERIYKRRKELEAQRHPSPVKAVNQESGLEEREATRRVKAYRDSLASPMGRMVTGLRVRKKTSS